MSQQGGFLRQRRRSIRIPLTFVAAIVAAATALSVAPANAASKAGAAKPATARAAGQPLALGADIKASGGQNQQQAIAAFEATTGRHLAYTRDYLLWNSPFPTSYEQFLGARGTVPFISVKPQTVAGAAVSWASIAASQPGDPIYTQMVSWADKVKAFGYPVYFTFNHEPEAAASNKIGTNPADYIAAWQKFHSVFVAEGVTNAKWIWIMTSFAFIVPTSDPRYAWNWYPGDAYVDAIGADAYTAYTCDNTTGIWHPLSYQIAGFVKFGAQHPAKPMWLPEFGVVEDPNLAGRKAQWITDAQALFKGAAYQQFVGIAYFNETRLGTACDWHVSTSASAQSAYNALAQDPFYAGSAMPAAPDTTAPTVSITSPADGSSQSGTVTVNATAGDDVAVASVAFSVDGTLVSTDTTAPYTASVDTTALTNDTHALTAVATDTSGNTATSTTVNITVANAPPPPPDTTPPTVSITSPADGSSQSGSITVNATAADDVAVASVGFYVDGTLSSTATTAPYAATIDTTKLSNGTHNLTAVATDTSSNATTSSPVGITVSNVIVVPTSCPATPAGSTQLSTNLSLESNQTGWTGVYNANSTNSRVQVTGGSYDGNWALQLAPKAGTTGAAGVNNASPYWVPGSPGLATTVGKKYTGSAEVQASAAGQQVVVLVRETTASGTGVSYSSTTVTLNDTAWHAITTTYTAKNAGDSIRYSLYGNFTASTRRVFADCLSLQSTP